MQSIIKPQECAVFRGSPAICEIPLPRKMPGCRHQAGQTASDCANINPVHPLSAKGNHEHAHF